MMLDRECAILVDTIVTAWRHRLTGDAFINKCGWHPVPANIVDATRDLEQLSGDRVFLVRWQSDNHIMAAEHTSNTGSPFVHWITRRCISKNASTVDNVDRLNDSDDRSEEPSSKMDLIAVRLPFDRTKLERLVHGHASMMLEDVHLHGVLT